MPQAKPLHIFKPGRWTTMAGEEIQFSAADLQATAAAYDPAKGKAPLVIGHPATDDPAQGWAVSLSANERGLFATPEKVDPAFSDLVRAGRYGTVSAKFYRPTDATNPVPGVWYLRHIGFLGAANPAVKGLDEPEFADTQDGCVCFREGVEFSEWDDATNAGLWRGLREWILAKFGAEEADKVIPGYAVADLERGAQEEINKSRTEAAAVPAFSDPNPQPETSVTPEQIAALEAENQRLRTQIAQNDAAQRHAANLAFADGLVAEGRMLPAARDVVAATLDHLAAQAEPVEFGEGDARAPLLDAYKNTLAAQPKIVEFGEQATRDRAAAGAAGKTVDFAAPGGYTVDATQLAVHQKALAHQAATGCSYTDAVKAVS